MIIEIALGIVLAVVLLALLWFFLPLILHIGLLAIGIVAVGALLYLLFQTIGSEATALIFIIVLFGGVIAWGMWYEKRKSVSSTREKLGYSVRSVEPERKPTTTATSTVPRTRDHRRQCR